MQSPQGRLHVAGPPRCHVAPVPRRGCTLATLPAASSLAVPGTGSGRGARARVGGCWQGGGQDGTELLSPVSLSLWPTLLSDHTAPATLWCLSLLPPWPRGLLASALGSQVLWPKYLG